MAEVTFHELTAHIPACRNLAASTVPGGTVAVAPSCSDPDRDRLAYAISSGPSKGSVSVVGGKLKYTAKKGASGTDTFTYTASDGKGGLSAAATVTIEIKAGFTQKVKSGHPHKIKLGVSCGTRR